MGGLVHWGSTTRCCRRVNPFGAAGALEQLSPGLPLLPCFVVPWWLLSQPWPGQHSSGSPGEVEKELWWV